MVSDMMLNHNVCATIKQRSNRVVFREEQGVN
jgi:hypothetical protein